MPKLRLYILFLPFLLLSRQLHSQDSKQYSFTHYSPSAGLASNETTSARQDETGYIWIGTNNGLQRFDGTRYITFRHNKNDTNSIPHNYIQQILIDKQHKLWILTGDGKAGIFDTRKLSYHEVPVEVKNERVKMAARRLIEDETGNLFILYIHWDFVTLNKERTKFSRAFNFIPVPDDNKSVGIIHQPGTANYWIARDKGFLVYNSKTRQLTHPNDPPSAGNPLIAYLSKIELPRNLFFDNQNRLWFDSWIGGVPQLFLYHADRKEMLLDSYRLNIPVYHETTGYLQQKDGTIWIRGLGVFARYLEKEKKFQKVEDTYHNEQSISYEIIFDFFEDREESIWLATSNNGLYRFAPASQFFTNIPHIDPRTKMQGTGSVMSFFRTKQGTLLAGTWSDGLFHYDRDFNVIPLNIKGLPPEPHFIWSMSASPDSNIIWMGAQPGLYKINQKTQSAEYFNPPVLKSKTLRQVVQDRFGNLWIGTQNIGLFKWSAAKGNKKFDDGVSFFPGLPDAQILKILIDSKGIVWVGTHGHGVYAIDPSTDKVITHLSVDGPADQKLLWHSASGLLQYDDSTIVIGSGGLHFYNTRQKKMTRTIPTPQSVPGYMTAIEKDRYGYVWVSSTSGIFRVNPKNGIFIHFDRIDGIANDHFIDAASYVLPDGRIIFGADNQIVLFNPEEVKINNPSPDIAITGIRVMNKPLLVDSLLRSNTIELEADENSLTIDFSGLSYNSTYIITYKLEDIDKEWRTADNTNQAIYTYLPAGKYTFLVRSEDAEGYSGKNTTRLTVIVRPHFWRTWWFYSLLVLLVVVVLYRIDKERVSRLKDMQKVRTEIANNLHKDVTTTLSHINLLGEMAKIKADKDINRSKEYIDQISSKSHNMIIAMDDILWSIDPENDSMEKTLLRMMEFTDAMKQRHNASIELAVDKKIRSLKLDMKVRNEFFLIFKEGLRMIVQYAGGRDTLINIDLFRNKLSLKLQDATARMDTHIDEIEQCIKEINTRTGLIMAEADIQYDRNGIAIILLIPAK